MALLFKNEPPPLTYGPSVLLTSERPMRVGAMALYPYHPVLERYCKFKTNFGEDVNMSVRAGNTLYIPREACPLPLDSLNDWRVSYPTTAINCNFEPLNKEQEELPNRSISLLKQGVNHIFRAPTGWGKTIVGSYIAAQMGQPTMIVVTKQDLLDQWKDALINILGIDPTLIGHVQQSMCDWKGKQFVLGMVHSLVIEDKYPLEMYQHFGMLLLDEVHLMAADSFVKVCQLFPAKYRLGFSATEHRSDGKSKLLYAHIGETRVIGTLVPMKPKILVRKTGWKIPVIRKLIKNEWVYIPIPHAPARMVLVYKAMAKSAARNMEITHFTKQAFDKGRRTLILSDLKEHLERLFHLLVVEGIEGQNIGYYVGGMSKVDLDSNKKRHVILGTFKMCSTGTNVPIWDTLVMAVPKANIKQPLGRILRHMDNKNQPIALELVDNDKLLENFHLSRLKQYYAVGATMVKM